MGAHHTLAAELRRQGRSRANLPSPSLGVAVNMPGFQPGERRFKSGRDDMVKVKLRGEMLVQDHETMTAGELIELLQTMPADTAVTFRQGWHYQITGGTQVQVLDSAGCETEDIEYFQLYGW